MTVALIVVVGLLWLAVVAVTVDRVRLWRISRGQARDDAAAKAEVREIGDYARKRLVELRALQSRDRVGVN